MSNISLGITQQLLNLVSQKIGLTIRESDQGNFKNHLQTRIKSLQVPSAEEYYKLLNGNNQASRQEWQKLSILLTNLESYFFRDKGQINLIKNFIIPNLVEQNFYQKRLRIISAGCSTGEEPYSLAILLHETIPNIEEWQIEIIGLDINVNALEHAKNGVYGSWSLRTLSPEYKEKYFIKKKENYELLSDFKKLVKFKQLNLVNDDISKLKLEIGNADFVLCRNVFIYFNTDSVQKVIDQFYQILGNQGYLITGHAEVSTEIMRKFKSQSFPESIVYTPLNTEEVKPNVNQTILFSPTVEKMNNSSSFPVLNNNLTNKNLSPINQININNNSLNNVIQPISKPLEIVIQSNPITPIKEVVNFKESPLLIEVEKLLKQKSYQSAIDKIKQLIQQYPKESKPQQLMAQIYANMGDYNQAKIYCEQALKIDSFAVYPHYILSHIAEENGDREEAKRLLKKIIYLNPNFIPAYLELNYIYLQEKDINRAEKTQKTILKILAKLNPHDKISEYDDLTVAELQAQLEQ